MQAAGYPNERAGAPTPFGTRRPERCRVPPVLDPNLSRFLELVARELDAVDARIELGGKDPEDGRLVFRSSPTGARVVAVFQRAPEDRAALEARLEVLVASFFGMTEQAIDSIPPSRNPGAAGQRLDETLSRLTERAGAVAAIVFDLASPVLWGTSSGSSPERDGLIEATISRVRAAQKDLRSGHSTRLPVVGGVECIVRPFAGLYIIAMVFEGAVSEPTALGALLHAMPAIERLVISLPPIDPHPGGGKVVRLPARLR